MTHGMFSKMDLTVIKMMAIFKTLNFLFPATIVQVIFECQ